MEAQISSLRLTSPGSRPFGLLLSLLLAAVSLALALAGLGCRSERERGPAAASAAADAEWRWLVGAKRRLDASRTRLAESEAAGRAGTGSPAAAKERAAESERLRQEVDRLAADFGRRLVAYANAYPPVEGAVLDERQRATLRMKSDEEMVQARAYIERGGDYQRAIEIYEAALAVDPGNAPLARALAEARRMRYMTAERFAQVKPGLSESEVRGFLGQPNLHNVREYPKRDVVAWFYPKDATGAAAAVWFRRRQGERELSVYVTDFEAVQPGGDEGPEPAAPPRAETGA